MGSNSSLLGRDDTITRQVKGLEAGNSNWDLKPKIGAREARCCGAKLAEGLQLQLCVTYYIG
jgi:hypothetical protein